MSAGPSTEPRPEPERPSFLPTGKAAKRLRIRRRRNDGLSKFFVGVGGISVIVALFFIFIYLFIEVFPMLRPVAADRQSESVIPGNEHQEVAPELTETGPDATFYIALERYLEVGVRFAGDGRVVFFEPNSGDVLHEERLEVPEGVEIVSVAAGEPRTQVVALGLSDGTAIVVRHDYDLTYPDGVRKVLPKVEYPLGDDPVQIDLTGQALGRLGIQRGSTGGYIISAYTSDGRLLLVSYAATTNFMTREVSLERKAVELPRPENPISSILVSMTLHDLIVGDFDGNLYYYDIRNLNNVELVDSESVIADGEEVSALNFLLGTVSIIVGGGDGSLTQWMLVRDDSVNRRLFNHVREFEKHSSSVTSINPEYSRKGFITGDESGNIKVHFSTSGKTLLNRPLSDSAIRHAMLSPYADGFIAVDAVGKYFFYRMDNPHPQVSMQALWGKVQYEGYADGLHMWQSSSATDEFEPKFSLVPMTVGTIKAAFFAMLFAMPVAILGAIYSAYFMTPKMRSLVKPCIELMEALPTVILGFLAGLWLAPFIEANLPIMITLTLGIPLGVVIAGFIWSRLPREVRTAVPAGWEAALLIPVILGVGALCIWTSPLMQVTFFNGDMRQWFTDVGINYDQRNAMIVGIAMGFAVIPTIFSISEDAIFDVPKHLTQGSLALGATPWQTMVGVVLLTASPGLFSAVMIGLGRAVGETMIVLMASGNSPIVNFNIFEGLRTLSANIAVEMPETEVGGTHYRILFLSALILFGLTFVFNTAAEVVRQRLRKKYASL
ncbi:MAG: phosphate ABC transporter permease [Verrucomicrobiales bacterium]